MTDAASLFGGLPGTGYVRQAQLIPDIVPFSSATLWREVKAGRFPAPVKLSQFGHLSFSTDRSIRRC